ncbi:MAG: hypothetical protein ABIT01_16740 [Thermoanaerobaculia bacterium]
MPDEHGAAAALDALFESDPGRAAEIAQDRFERSLRARCVPSSLVALLGAKGLDPYAAVARRLRELECDRHRLKPAESLFSGDARATERAREASEKISPGACRTAFQELFGIEPKPPEALLSP